jgi:hypothetical protein
VFVVRIHRPPLLDRARAVRMPTIYIDLHLRPDCACS